MKILIISIILTFSIYAQNTTSIKPQTNSLKVYEIDLDNKLSLVDTALIYAKDFSVEKPYNDTIILEELIEVAYPDISFLKYMKSTNYHTLDSTEDDGIVTYTFSSWCNRDTTDWETGDNGKIIYEIEYSNCKIQDILKVDSKNRLIHYTYRFNNNDRSEDYIFDENDNLIEVNSPKGHFILSYDEYNRIDKIVEDYQDLGNIIETMGSSLKREIEYDFRYE